MKSVARLYKNFQPENYKLHVVILDPASLQFNGHIIIRGRKTGRPSQRITLHQNDLNIDKATITRRDKKGERAITVSRINHHKSLQEVRLHTDEMLYPGEYEVYVTFHGTITRAMTGLYPCYFNLDGKEHMLLATQFESHFARNVFPCIDEPEAKATFDLMLTTPTDLTVLANTPVLRQEHLDPQTTSHISTTFETTPKMSTYLLAFVIGELQSKTTITKHGTNISTWATIAQPMDALDYALDVAKRSVEFFEDYFGIPYPLPKLDHVALPDFTSGAMENWGLITYRERLLLAYPGEASQSVREYISMVIAHETSHQWFGNLVTMKWWNDLWLNESFANMMEYQAIDHIFPEWHIWDTFTMNEGLAALRRDASKGVQAIKAEVHHPDEINTLFDGSIVYAKGGRILAMLKAYLGETAFRKSLTSYFKKHAYGNTTGADLWQALSEVSGTDVAAFMNPWLERSGFPVVSVNLQGNKVELRQTHFLESGPVSDDQIWPAPLFSNHRELPKLFDKAALSAKLESSDPLIVNEHAIGHYLVDYVNPAHRQQLVELIAEQKLAVTDRLMLLHGASTMSRAGMQPFGDVLNLLAAYAAETAEPVWDIIAGIVGEARRFLDLDDTLEAHIKTYVGQLVEKEYKRLGWQERPDESVDDRKLRATIIGLGAYAERPDIVNEAKELFNEYVTRKAPLPPELRGIIFGVVVREKVADAVDYLLRLHDTTANSDLKADVMGGLTTTHDPDEAKALLDRLTDAKLVKPQDADYWFFYLVRNRHTREVAWDWMVKHWDWIEKTYGEDKSYDDFPRVVAGACSTSAWAKKYEEFFGPKRDQLILERNIAIGLNEIATRVAWLERDLASVQAFFKA